MSFSIPPRILPVLLAFIFAGASLSFGQEAPPKPSPESLGALLELFSGPQNAPSPEDLKRMKEIEAKVAAIVKAENAAIAAKAAEAAKAAATAKAAEAAKPAPDLGALFGDVIKQLNIQATPDGKVKINGQEIDPQTALLDMQKEGPLKPGETPKFLQGVIKPEQLDALRKQAEATQPSPEQVKQLELMAQRLQQALGGQPLPAAPAPKPVPPKPFVP